MEKTFSSRLQVKIFVEEDTVKLEEQINDFLKNNKIDLIDVQYKYNFIDHQNVSSKHLCQAFLIFEY